jgi:hypothetical protein
MRDRTPTTRTPGRAPTPALGVRPALGLALGLVVGLMLGLAGCGSTDPTAPASPTLTTAPTTPTTPVPTSPTSGPPAMPDAARQHTKAGAKAFVTYFWQVVDYAQHTLDTKPLEEISNDDCIGCNRGINGLKKDAQRGATILGGDNTVSHYKSGPLRLGTTTFTQALFSLTNTEQTETFSNGHTKHSKAATVRMRMLLQPTADGWSVETLEPAG